MINKNLGILLLVIGLVMIAYTGFNYVTTEKVVDIGPLEINADKKHFVQWSPYVGLGLTIIGLFFIMFKNNKA